MIKIENLREKYNLDWNHQTTSIVFDVTNYGDKTASLKPIITLNGYLPNAFYKACEDFKAIFEIKTSNRCLNSGETKTIEAYADFDLNEILEVWYKKYTFSFHGHRKINKYYDNAFMNEMSWFEYFVACNKYEEYVEFYKSTKEKIKKYWHTKYKNYMNFLKRQTFGMYYLQAHISKQRYKERLERHKRYNIHSRAYND